MPASLSGPDGATTTISYRRYDPGIWAVDTMTTADAQTGNALSMPVTVSLDPDNTGHNYTGFPDHHAGTVPQGAGTRDPLVFSDDNGYAYATTMSDVRVTRRYEYNHLLQLDAQSTLATVHVAQVPLARTTSGSPGDDGHGQPARWGDLPATYPLP